MSFNIQVSSNIEEENNGGNTVGEFNVTGPNFELITYNLL
jgi:hypothetical protein